MHDPTNGDQRRPSTRASARKRPPALPALDAYLQQTSALTALEDDAFSSVDPAALPAILARIHEEMGNRLSVLHDAVDPQGAHESCNQAARDRS